MKSPRLGQTGRRPNRIVGQKLAIARKVVDGLQRDLGANLRAAGVQGSVARGTAQKYSDIDFLLVVRKPTEPRDHVGGFMILDDTYCSLGFETWNSAVQQLTTPNHELSELLGGFTKILPLYDPERLLPRLEAMAKHVPNELFVRSAERALNHSYEDFCRVKNAYANGDEVVLRDNVWFVTHSAALVVASLNRTCFVSDREIFKAHRRFQKLPKGYRRIEQLRYGNLRGRQLLKIFLGFYRDLVSFAIREGVHFPVSQEALIGPIL